MKKQFGDGSLKNYALFTTEELVNKVNLFAEGEFDVPDHKVTLGLFSVVSIDTRKESPVMMRFETFNSEGVDAARIRAYNTLHRAVHFSCKVGADGTLYVDKDSVHMMVRPLKRLGQAVPFSPNLFMSLRSTICNSAKAGAIVDAHFAATDGVAYNGLALDQGRLTIDALLTEYPSLNKNPNYLVLSGIVLSIINRHGAALDSLSTISNALLSSYPIYMDFEVNEMLELAIWHVQKARAKGLRVSEIDAAVRIAAEMAGPEKVRGLILM